MAPNRHITLYNLPSEIVQQIVFYLDIRDIVECVRVSKSWNTIFRCFRRLSIKLTNSWEFSNFLTAVEQHTRTAKRRKLNHNLPRVDNLGEYIYALNLEDGIMSVQDMKRLSTLCPNIESIRFNWCENGKMGRSRRSLQEPVFYSPVPFFQHFRPNSLIRLDMNGSVSQLPADTISSVLSQLPQLESLTITLDIFEPTPATMEEFHDACPNLKHLKISHVSSFDDKYTGAFDMEPVVPAYTMESLSFPDRVSDDFRFCDGQWFKYIKRKYPSLTSLSIIPDVTSKHRMDSVPIELAPIATTLVLRDHWPYLMTVNLGLFAGQPSLTYPQLVKNIPNISLLYDHGIRFNEWIDSSGMNDVVRLTLRILPKALDGIMRCVCLQELTLGKSDGRLSSYQELPLEVVLSCPALETLTIHTCLLRYESISTASSSRLKRLLVENSVFDGNRVLINVSKRCRQLTHVNLNSCFWKTTCNYPTIQLCFPQQWFTFFCVRNPRIFLGLRKARPPTYLTQPDRPPGFTQPRWEIEQVMGHNECFMLNTPEHTKDNLPLYWITETRFNRKVTVNRMNNADIMHYLEKSEDDSKDPARILEAKKAMALLRGSNVMQLKSTCWSTVLYCRGVDRFYYNTGRVSMDDLDLVAVK